MASADASPQEPEVLIEPGETAVLRRLMRGGRGRVDPSAIDTGVTAAASIPPLKDLTVTPIPELIPITIPPLSAVNRNEGAPR